MTHCEESRQKVFDEQFLQGPTRPSDVHENVDIMSGATFLVTVVIVCTCIIGCRLRTSVRMTHEEPSQHEAQLQKFV